MDKELKIPSPSREQVESYIEKWSKKSEYVDKEKSLNTLFKNYPHNNDISEILLKAAAINSFYSTNVFSIYEVAEHIKNKNIDPELESGEPRLVEELKQVPIKNSKTGIINFYSFTTKYCSFHKPDKFPIYDSYVDKVLRYFRNHDEKYNNGYVKLRFKNDDLKDYVKYKSILIAFRKIHKLDKCNFKQLDQYLWQLGKEYFSNK